MTDQERLDHATDRLAKAIRAIDVLTREAQQEASARCNTGQLDVSADLRDIEADLRAAGAYLTRAYAKGRRLSIPGDGGGIVAFAGGS